MFTLRSSLQRMRRPVMAASASLMLAVGSFSHVPMLAHAQGTNFGAIATSDSGNSYSYVVDMGSMEDALDAAASLCDGCVARVWFSDSCAAVTQSDVAVGWGLGSSRAEAEANAMDALPDGSLVAWACTTR